MTVSEFFRETEPVRYIQIYVGGDFFIGIGLWNNGGLIVPQAVVNQARWKTQKPDSVIQSKSEGMRTMEANPNLSPKTQESGG